MERPHHVVLTAAREVAHASAHLVNVARLLRTVDAVDDPSYAPSLAAARAAFRLDDLARRESVSATDLLVTEEALRAAEDAIRVTRALLVSAAERERATTTTSPDAGFAQAK